MFSQTTEYAMRALLALAASAGGPVTTRRIAETMQVPRSYLSKVLQAMVREGLVRSTRGLRGGFVLARDPQDIHLLEIMNAVSPIRRIEHCPLDLTGHGSDLCPLHRRLDQAIAQVQEAFGATTLAELLAEDNPCPVLRNQLEQLVDFDPPK